MTDLDDALARDRLVAVIRHADPEVAAGIARAAHAGGLRALEITMTVPGSDALIAALRAELPTALVGAGTVLSLADAEQVLAAGAAFVVSPGLRHDVLDACREAGVPAVPGTFTTTELLVARDAGCRLVKLFPAGSLGPAAVAAFRDVLPDVALLPTGGVAVEDAPTWWERGALAVGVGSELTRAWAEGGATAVQELARRGVELAAAAG